MTGGVYMVETKKPVYKKWWMWLIVFFAALVIYGAATGINQAQKDVDKNETEAAEKEESQENEVKEDEADLSREEEIQAAVEDVIAEDFKGTDIDKIAVNENLGLEDGSYIVQPHLTWNVKNKEKTTREMLEQYSDHLAAKLAAETDVSEITVFWEVPYHKEDNNVAKFSYTREDDKMMVEEAWYDTVIRE